MVLLDTNVLSELMRARPDPGVVRFVGEQSDAWLSVITLHELHYGLELLPLGKRRTALTLAVSELLAHQTSSILDVAPSIAHVAAQLRATASRQGKVLQLADALIAATAVTRGLTLATRNTSGFEGLGVQLVDPWEPKA